MQQHSLLLYENNGSTFRLIRRFSSHSTLPPSVEPPGGAPDPEKARFSALLAPGPPPLVPRVNVSVALSPWTNWQRVSGLRGGEKRPRNDGFLPGFCSQSDPGGADSLLLPFRHALGGDFAPSRSKSHNTGYTVCNFHSLNCVCCGFAWIRHT